MASSKRINYIDIAKGIAIICVIIGHTFSAYDTSRYVTRFIYSFHMPLFFILSGWFVKDEPVDIGKFVVKKAKQLLLPYLMINTLRYITKIILVGFTSAGLKHFVLSLFYANGNEGKRSLCLIQGVPIIGMTWFLVALFFCQILYVCLNNFSKKYNVPLGILVIALGLTAYGLNSKVWLPFSLQPAMGGLVFYYVGHLMKKAHILESKPSDLSWSVVVIGALLWVSAMLYGTVGMQANAYPGMHSFVGAVCGTYLIVQLSKMLEHVPLLGRFLLWCGSNSIYIYALHAFDIRILKYLKAFVMEFFILPSTKGALLFSAIRICCVLSAAFIFAFAKNKILRLNSKLSTK